MSGDEPVDVPGLFVRTNFERHSCDVAAARPAICTDAGMSQAAHDPWLPGEVWE
jgi:hypothetical protein